MELTLEFLLYIFLLAVTCFAYFFQSSLSQHKKNPPLPPGSSGWPIIGETLELQRMARLGKSDQWVLERMKKHNKDAFKTSLVGEKTIAVCGADANKFIFTSEKRLVLTWWPTSLKKLFGDSFFTAPYAEALQTRKMVMTFLHQEVMNELVERFDKTCKKCIRSEWSGKTHVMAFALIKNYAFSLSCEMFTSVGDSEWQAKILKEFNILVKGVFQLPIYFPGTRHYKAVRSADIIRHELIKVIEKKRREDSNGRVEKDLISFLMDARDENGKKLSNKEIADNVILLMEAGHDTSSSTMMMLMKHLAENPSSYHEVLEEQREIARQKNQGELLNKDDIQKMKYSWNVVSEVLRLSPPIQGMFRKAIVDFTYAGFSIPKGWAVWWSTSSTHRDAKYFSVPEKFDPTRFDRTEALTPYSYIPFGGGPRMCPGKEFARIEILVFLHNLICEFRWELEFPDETICADPFPGSPKGLPVYLFPHN